jgi:hypothetical protein
VYGVYNADSASAPLLVTVAALNAIDGGRRIINNNLLDRMKPAANLQKFTLSKTKK